MNKEIKWLLFLISIFVSLLVVSNVIAVKTINVFGFIGPAAVICYSLTYAITDTISEIWGKRITGFVVMLGFGAVVISAIFVRLAIIMPGSPFWDKQSEYAAILGANMRIVIASMAAYLVSQWHDVWAFHFIKSKTGTKWLWLRNNISSMFSQLFDTCVFIFIAFYGTGAPIWQMIIGQYVIKVAIAAIDTPIVYALVGIIKRNVGAFALSEAVSKK